MRYLVCWFLALVEDAAAIRSTVTTKARQRHQWRHLVLPGVDGPDMNKVEKLAKPKRANWSSKIGGELLDRSKMTDNPFTAVSRLTPEFLQTLAAADEATLSDLGRRWSQALDGVNEEAAVTLVHQMADFARQASAAGQPVLELVVM